MIIGGMLPIKGKGTFAPFVQLDERKRRIVLSAARDAQPAQPARRRIIRKKRADRILSDAADERALRTKFPGSARHVEGRAARSSLITERAAYGRTDHIGEQLAHAKDHNRSYFPRTYAFPPSSRIILTAASE